LSVGDKREGTSAYQRGYVGVPSFFVGVLWVARKVGRCLAPARRGKTNTIKNICEILLREGVVYVTLAHDHLIDGV